MKNLKQWQIDNDALFDELNENGEFMTKHSHPDVNKIKKFLHSSQESLLSISEQELCE